jgi:hypothetical protein
MPMVGKKKFSYTKAGKKKAKAYAKKKGMKMKNGMKNGMKKKVVPKKHKGFSKLPEAVQRKINKKLAKKV